MEALPLELVDDAGDPTFHHAGTSALCRRHKWAPKGNRQPTSSTDQHLDSPHLPNSDCSRGNALLAACRIEEERLALRLKHIGIANLTSPALDVAAFGRCLSQVRAFVARLRSEEHTSE